MMVPGEGDRGFCFRVWVLNNQTYSRHFDQLWLFALTAALCKRKPLWPRLTTALIYGYRHNYLEGGLPTCPFSRLSVVNSSLGSVTSFAIRFDYILILETGGNLEFSCLLWLPHRTWLKNGHHRTQFLAIIGPLDPDYGNSLISLLSFLGQY